MPDPPPLFPLAPIEEARWAELGELPMAELKAVYFALSKMRPLSSERPVDTLLSRRTLTELIIWYERSERPQDRWRGRPRKSRKRD